MTSFTAKFKNIPNIIYTMEEKNQTKEEQAVVLDYLQHGYPFDKRPSHQKTPIAQALGTTFFTLLELVPKKEIFLQPYEEVYISGLSTTLNDLVVLAMNGKDLPYIDLNNSMALEVGDKVVAIGNPEGLVNTVSEGIISGLRYLGEYPYYQMTAPISPGSSGGAVFDDCGNIIGISTFYIEGGQNLNFCIPIAELGNIEIFEEAITLVQFQEFLKEERTKK